MSIDRNAALYSVNDLISTMRQYENDDSVCDFVSDVTGLSVDALYCMMTEEEHMSDGTGNTAGCICDPELAVLEETARKRFLSRPTAYKGGYSWFMVIGKTKEEVCRALARISARDKTYSMVCEQICGGTEEPGYVKFDVMECHPHLIYELTKELGTTGYSTEYTDEVTFICAKDGKDCDDFTAEWAEEPPYYDTNMGWEALAVITDNKTGFSFYVGNIGLKDDGKDTVEKIVRTHK